MHTIDIRWTFWIFLILTEIYFVSKDYILNLNWTHMPRHQVVTLRFSHSKSVVTVFPWPEDDCLTYTIIVSSPNKSIILCMEHGAFVGSGINRVVTTTKRSHFGSICSLHLSPDLSLHSLSHPLLKPAANICRLQYARAAHGTHASKVSSCQRGMEETD